MTGPCLRRWFAHLYALRRWDIDEVRVAVVALAEAASATLPAYRIRVDSILPFTSPGVFEVHVARYMAACGDHRPIVVIGRPVRLRGRAAEPYLMVPLCH